MDRNESCWCGSGKKWKKCHWPEVGQTSFAALKQEYWNRYKIYIKDEKEIEGIRKAGHLAAKILDAVTKEAKAGVTTKYLDKLAHEMTLAHGAHPACLGYGKPPYPAVLCTSLNDVICHGIPDERPLQEGDIVNIDYVCNLNGYFGDCSKMVAIGEVSEEKRRVMDTCYDALMAATVILKPGVLISQIGDIITDVAQQKKLSVVQDFVGHGIGLAMHENPQVPHSRNKLNIPLIPGMIFTIEPMLNVGVIQGKLDPKDGWTVRTIDGKPSAQWEHQILITETGYEILTPWHRI